MSRLDERTPGTATMSLALALALGLVPLPAEAQHAGHEGHAPATPTEDVPAKKKPATSADPHAGHAMPASAPAVPAKKKPAPTSADPHAGRTMPASAPAVPAKKKPAPTPADAHAGHTMPASAPAAPAKKRSAPAAADPHAGHDMGTSPPAPAASDPHAGHVMPANPVAPVDHAAMGQVLPAPDDAPRTPIPALTDADRAAAFPVVGGHAAHDRKSHSYWLIDRLEWRDAAHGSAVGWDSTAWIGGDVNRLWLRSAGDVVDGDLEDANVEVLGGRAFARWWDVVAGVRHDVGDGPPQTFAAVGVIGVAPGKFGVEATAYLGESGQTGLDVEAEYDTLLTNRLILQWRAEAAMHGKDDPARGIGSGLGTVAVGARLRYEIDRRFAPYVGVEHERAIGDTASLRMDDRDTRVVVGVRIWF
jgi:copper resistance protein B